jgi:alkanesulfonate monooxygenase SsuD/methylene tetrahydromethanopterin reductase-like flavin-dependent oxidoreductase (luciferase family)
MTVGVPLWHPLRLAEEIRFLDLITGGRLEVGLGPGGPRDVAQWGLDAEDLPEMFEAGVALVRRFLIEGGFGYDTAWWRGQAPAIAAVPEQRPLPPLWLASIRGASVEKAARWGLNCTSGMAATEVVARRVEQYRSTWLDQHPDTTPGRFSAFAQVVVHEERREALRLGIEFHERLLARRARSSQARPHAEAAGEPRTAVETFHQAPFPELTDQGLVICGDVDDCVEQVRRSATQVPTY